MKRALSVALISLASYSSLVGQTGAKPRPATFHIQGRIESIWDYQVNDGVLVSKGTLSFHGQEPLKTVQSDDKDTLVVIPRTEITFHNSQTTKTIVVGKRGSYQADLPVGTYTLTVEAPSIGGTPVIPYSRVFRVTSPRTIVISTELELDGKSCDVLPPGNTPEEAEAFAIDECGGVDHVPLPSSDGIPFELYVRFGGRTRGLHRNEYTHDVDRYLSAVVVAYNLFSLKADEVSYDTEKHILHANGNVAIADASGTIQHAPSANFLLKEGQALAIAQEK